MIMQSIHGKGFKAIEVIVTLILNAAYCSGAQDDILSCSVSSLDPCPGENQICNQTSNLCDCIVGYVMVNKVCETPSHEDPSTNSATAAVVVIFTLALVICGLVLVIKKYNLIDYLRQKINLKRRGDVMYEDVMIGQDDPPLTP